MSGVSAIGVSVDEDGMRLDRWFKEHFPDLAHGRLQKLLRTGQVRVDGARSRANTRLTSGQTIRIPPLPDAAEGPREPVKPVISLKDAKWVQSMVIHRDHEIIVLDKPAGLAVQGGTRTERHLDGLLDALKFDAPERPRLVHRLDRDTSGLLVLARTRKAATALGKAFKTHEVRKIYWALVAGVPRPDRGTVDMALVKAGKLGDQRVRPAHEGDTGGQKAISHYATISPAAPRATWVALFPVTGRTHQLRAHMAAIDHPIIGDGKYGNAGLADAGQEIAKKLHLHARSLSLPHPSGGRRDFVAPLPEHMQKTWTFLGFAVRDAEDPFEELDL